MIKRSKNSDLNGADVSLMETIMFFIWHNVAEVIVFVQTVVCN